MQKSLCAVAAAATAGSAFLMLMSPRAQRWRWWLRQRWLRTFLIERDTIDVTAARLVGGVDISFVKDSESDACAALVILDAQSLAVVHESYRRVQVSAPYIPGFLAFREVNFLLDMVHELQRDLPEFVPDVIMVDGNGILHPNRFGLASHLGVMCGIPTVGIGKKLHHVDGLDKHTSTTLCAPSSGKLMRRHDHALLIGLSGATWGALLRTTEPADGNFKPIIISVGHGVSLDSAIELTKRCTMKRIPEPVRQADLRSRAWLRQHRE